MKNLINKYNLLFIFLLLNTTIYAQIEVSLKAVQEKHFVKLRWAPNNYETWKNAQTYGYELYRQRVGQDEEIFNAPKESVKLGGTFKPLTEEQWKAQINTKLDTIAFAAFYDADFKVYVGDGSSTNPLVKAYQLDEEKKNRFAYSLFAAEQNIRIASKMGLFFFDRGTKLEPNSTYRYIVYPLIADNKKGKPSIIDINIMDTPPTLPQIPTPEGKSGDKTAMIAVNVQGYTSAFSYYNIYRDNGSGGAFKKINSDPILYTNDKEQGAGGDYIYFAGDLPNNTQTFKFYAVGVDAFERSSPPSEQMSIKGTPAELRTTVNITSVTDLNGGISINWYFPDSLNAKIQGFKVFRSETAAGYFKPLQTTFLANTTRSFSDMPPKGAAYYRIKAFDYQDRAITSIDVLGQVKDISPPAKPVISSCTCDEKGNGRITWKRNTEGDIKGYRVYLSSIRSAESYFQITNDVVTDSTFEYEINMNTLTEEAYFNITAEDLHSNQSPFSVPCTMKRPDVIPPVAPIITKADITSQGVDMEWIPSSSDDVVLHQVERKQLSQAGAWQIIYTVPIKSKNLLNTYLDSTAQNGYSYLYRITAIDDAKLSTYSKTMQVRPTTRYNRAPITTVTAYCNCAYVDSLTKIRYTAAFAPNVNGNHPIVEFFHLKTNSSSQGSSALIDSYTNYGTAQTRDLSTILEWSYIDKGQDLQDFVIYRRLPREPMREYGFSKPNRMDVIYDPIAYSFAQDPSIRAMYPTFVAPNSKALLPIQQSKPQQTVHQFMDHLIPFRSVTTKSQGGRPQPVKYYISARFQDGSESPLSAPIEVYFN